MLADAGVARKDCFITNVFAFQPPDNKLDSLQIGTLEAKKIGANAKSPMSKGHYLHPEFWPELERLKHELLAVRPNVIVALGGTALWALTGLAGISAVRGTALLGPNNCCAPGLKIIPTYHPASVLRQWDQRVIVIADFIKAWKESSFPEIRRPERAITIDPTLEEIKTFASKPHRFLSVDIETARGQITCIGFAPSITESLVIPFVDFRRESRSYWPNQWQEEQAWKFVGDLLSSPAEKVFQNGLYDLQWLANMGLSPRNCLHDTMLLHWSIYSEMQKSLGFLGSIHLSEIPWKTLRKHKTEMEKRDE